MAHLYLQLHLFPEIARRQNELLLGVTVAAEQGRRKISAESRTGVAAE